MNGPSGASPAETPVRTLFFAPTLGGGGAEMQVVRLVNAFDSREIAASVAVARAGGSYESKLEPGSVFAVAPKVRSSMASVFGSVPGLVALMRRQRPEVVVSLQEHTSVSLLAAVQFVRPRPKVLLGIQNNLSAVREHSPAWAKALLFPLYRASYAQADHVVALSRGVAEDLSNQVFGLSARLSVVYNAGVDDDLPRLAQAELDEPLPAGPLIVACGRLTPQKDFPTLLQAMARLRAVPAAELWILGEGQERERLERSIRELGLERRVRLLGFRDNPYRYMAAADLFVLSSRWEGFANVVAEALACGTPVVTTDCPYGPAEILSDSQCGKLVPVGDASALAFAIDAMLADPRLESLGPTCRERARRFESSISANGYAAVITQLARGRTART
jgi:glycosyltransferase involved in cell wall biosynthesis